MRWAWTVAVITLVVSAGCGGSTTKTALPTTTAAPAPMTTVFPAQRTKTSLCRFNGALPDAECTPGALNPDVTPATVATTICATTWTTTVRPVASLTDRLKSEVATAYGIAEPLSSFQGDHLIPLELGGAPSDIANFWDQPNTLTMPDGTIVAAGQKDALEGALRTRVCSGQLPLLDAQRQIAADWYGSWTAAGRPGFTTTTVPPTTSTTAATTPPTTAAVATTARPATTGAPLVATTAAPATTGPASVSYANCAAVRAAGKAPLYRGQPGYSSSLDRDGDGIACE